MMADMDSERIEELLYQALEGLEIMPNYAFGMAKGQAVEYASQNAIPPAAWDAASKRAIARYLEGHRHYLTGMLR